MGRGSTIVENILYGEIPARSVAAGDLSRQETIDGVVMFYDQFGELRKAIVTKEAIENKRKSRPFRKDVPKVKVNGIIVDAPAEIHILDGVLHRDGGPARMNLLDGRREWYQHGKRHREDGPAMIKKDGSQHWFYQNQKHREDGPAVIEANGSEIWITHGHKHREGGPAVVRPGREEWHQDGELHREDGPAIIDEEYHAWYKNGLPHRAGGPAVTGPGGAFEYYVEGSLHREDGPAFIEANGEEYYYWRGRECEDRDEWERLRRT